MNHFQYKDVKVDIYSQHENPAGRLIGGKIVFNEKDPSLTVIQNKPRGPKNRKKCDSIHGILMRRPDGRYVATMKFNPGDPYIIQSLIAEIRSFVELARKEEGYGE